MTLSIGHSPEGHSPAIEHCRRSDEVKELIGGTPGFISYVAFREGDGGMTVTSCEDKAGVDESSKRAADWIGENATAAVDPPEITEGPSFLKF